MTVYNPGLEADLNSILTILGTTKTHLWPFYESLGITVSGIGAGIDLIPSETGGSAEALEDDFNPAVLPNGLYSYHFQPTGDHHLAGPDDNSYSFVSAAFSVGCWARPSAGPFGSSTSYRPSGSSPTASPSWLAEVNEAPLLSTNSKTAANRF